MQTSRLKKALSALLVAALVVGLFGLVNFALELKGTKSNMVWTNFAQTEELDTIYIGTSVAASSFNPNLIDEEYGSSSANMASPLQKLDETYLGIQSAYERFGIKRVVMTLDFTTLQLNETPNLGSAYLTQRGRVVGLSRYLSSAAWLIAEKGAASAPGSINMLFPWISNHPAWKDGVAGIKRNIETKLDGSSVAAAVEAMEPGWIYFGKGYGNKYAQLDYNSKDVALFGELEKIETLSFDGAAIAGVREICSYCADHDIELIVVNVPIPVFNIHGYGQFYVDSQQAVSDMLADMGVAYYDFVYAKPDLLQITPEDFYDNQHLNAVGADKFSRAFVTFMETLDAGGDTSALFYTPQEYLATIDYISAVKVSASSKGDGIEIKAHAYAGVDVDVEYQMLAKPVDADEWTLVRDYDDASSAVFTPGAKGTYDVRVNVRVKGSNGDYDHFNTAEVIY